MAFGEAGVLDAGFAEVDSRIQHDAELRRPTGINLVGEAQAADRNQTVLDGGHGELSVLAGGDKSIAEVQRHVGVVGPRLFGGERLLEPGVPTQSAESR